MGVCVARRHRGHPKPLRQGGEPAVTRAVVAPERPLQLDPEAVGPEGPQQPPGQLGGAGRVPALPAPRHGAVAGAAGEADQPLGVALELVDGKRRRERLSHRLALSRAAVGLGDQPAEARPAPRVLDQQGDVDRARHPPRHLHRQLAADDGADPDPRTGVRELHRATDVVVIGQGQGLVTEVRRSGRQLGRIRGPVQEGVGAVAVELYVVSRCRHQSRCRNQRSESGA